MVFIVAKATRIPTILMNNVKAMYRTRDILARTIWEIVRVDLQRALASAYRAPQSGVAFDLHLGTISGARPIS